MPNTIANSTWVLKETTRGYLNQIQFVKNLDRTYDDQYVQSGAKVGDTVKARLPQRFTVSDGSALQPQAINDRVVPISLTNQKNIGWSYSSREATTDLQMARERYAQPAAEALAAASDVLAWLDMYRDVYNAIGTPGGGAPSTRMAYLEAGVKLTDYGVRKGDRVAVLDPMAMAVISDAGASLFNPQGVVSAAYRTGQMGSDVLGIAKWLEDSNCPVHTTGTFTASTPVINGANQTGSTISTNGWASGASSLRDGDVFVIANVFGINPVSYQSTGRLQQFVATADTSDSAGAMATLPISPSIITSGQLQTVTASPATGAAITVLGATSAVAGTLAATDSKQSMIYTKDLGAFVMADLYKPSAGVETAAVRSKEFKVSIRLVEQFQILTDQNPSRLDILIGAAAIQPWCAVRSYQ